jgi:uncharacterized protein (TIGR02118 family)
MIKMIGGANRHPTNRSLDDFRQYWAEHHGPFFAHTPHLMRYVQHITLPEAYGGSPAPTHDGVSMFWYDDVEAVIHPPQSPRLIDAIPEEHADVYDWYVRSRRYGDPEVLTLQQTVRLDDQQLFDRSTEWPTAHRRSSVVANERVVKEGATTPSMVKAVAMVARKPGLTLDEFQQHWFEVHGPMVAAVPGVRRYVQNHAIAEAYAGNRPMTHDGFSELWFDDLAALQSAAKSPQWQAAVQDGRTLFAEPIALVIAHERIQKELQSANSP